MRSVKVQRSCRLTCWARPSRSLWRLCGSIAVRLAPSPTSGADGADVHFTDFKEGHHERLLIQCTVTSDEPCLLGADALSCLKKKITVSTNHRRSKTSSNDCWPLLCWEKVMHFNCSNYGFVLQKRCATESLTAAGLHTDLQTQVVCGTHHPQVTSGSDVKLQPALLSCPQPARLQQEQICLSVT